MAAITTDRIRKSVRLTPDEHRRLLRFITTQTTKLDASSAIGISRPTLDRILATKSGYQLSIDKIKEALLKDAGTNEEKTTA